MSTNGIICSMIADTVRKFNGVLYIENSNHNESSLSNTTASKDILSADPIEAKLIITTCLAFLTGLTQVIF
jgi:hypothetical protein